MLISTCPGSHALAVTHVICCSRMQTLPMLQLSYVIFQSAADFIRQRILLVVLLAFIRQRILLVVLLALCAISSRALSDAGHRLSDNQPGPSQNYCML